MRQRGGAADFPALLSATGCFSTSNPTQVASGVVPYTVAQPFWSDGAEKERYVAWGPVLDAAAREQRP